MDLDAEMAKLQVEAQRRLREREDEERAMIAADPGSGARAGELEAGEVRTFPGPESVTSPERGSGQSLSDLLKPAAALAKGVKTLGETQEAAQQAANTASRFSLWQKLGLGVASLVTFVVCWKLFLRPVVEAVVAVAVLILILVALGKLLGWTTRKRKKADND